MRRARLGQVLSKNQELGFSVLPELELRGVRGPTPVWGWGGAGLPLDSPGSSATSSLPEPLLVLPWGKQPPWGAFSQQ